jgi:hypothetical protein
VDKSHEIEIATITVESFLFAKGTVPEPSTGPRDRYKAYAYVRIW